MKRVKVTMEEMMMTVRIQKLTISKWIMKSSNTILIQSMVAELVAVMVEPVIATVTMPTNETLKESKTVVNLRHKLKTIWRNSNRTLSVSCKISAVRCKTSRITTSSK